MSVIELESVAWGLLYGAVIVGTIIAAVRDGIDRVSNQEDREQ